MRILLVCLALCATLAVAPAPFAGYIVTGQWDGRTVPSSQWALDITRQVTEWRPQQELKYQNLIPMRDGDALKPTFTAYDSKSRTFFLTTQRDTSTASLWGIVISGDTNTSKIVAPEVRFTYPEDELPLVGLQTWNNNGQLVVLAFFKNCVVLQVDYKTGATTNWATLCNDTRVLTTAIDVNGDQLFAITQNEEGHPAREVIIANIPSRQYESNILQPLKNHNDTDEMPFEMVWLPTLKNLMVFYTGQFDQLVYLEPHSGMLNFAIFNMAEYNGPDGNRLEFESDDRLESDDMWTDAALDVKTGKLYFQCSDVDPETGFFTTTLCQVQVPSTVKMLNYVNTAIWPLTYGYAGMQWVDVVQE